MADSILKVSGIIMVCLTVVLIVLAVMRRNKYPSAGAGAKVGKIIVSLLLVVACIANFVGMAFSNLIGQYFMTLNLDDPGIQRVRTASTQTAKSLRSCIHKRLSKV